MNKTAREVANEINGLKPGWEYCLTRQDLQDMHGDIGIFGRTPLEIIHDNIIGFNHGEIVMYKNIETGNYCFYRRPPVGRKANVQN